MRRAFISILLLAASISAASADTFSNPIYRLRLNETSGTQAEESVSGNHGALVNGPAWMNPGLRFTTGQGVQSPPASGNGVTDQLTLSAWVRQTTTGGGSVKGILGKGRVGSTEQQAYMLGTYQGRPFLKANWDNGTTGPSASVLEIAPAGITLNQWVHVAVTSNNSQIKFFVNGTNSHSVDRAVMFGNSVNGVWVGYDLNSFIGDIRDARIYNRALSAGEVAHLSAERALFSSSHAGLWSGTATLNEVKEAATGAWGAAPVFTERVLLHVDADGVGRLLAEATVMQTRTASPQQVVVSVPSLLPNFDGITSRGGRMIGQRFSTASFPLPDGSQVLSDGSGGWHTAAWNTPATDPVNPFRHKYHPDLGSGRALSRISSFSFAPGESPSDNVLTGTFMESFTGLHKTTLEARGPVTFTRVSTSGKLNQP